MVNVVDLAVVPPPVNVTDPDQAPGVSVASVMASRPQSVELASGVDDLVAVRLVPFSVMVSVQLPCSITLPGRIATADAVCVAGFQPNRVITRLVCGSTGIDELSVGEALGVSESLDDVSEGAGVDAVEDWLTTTEPEWVAVPEVWLVQPAVTASARLAAIASGARRHRAATLPSDVTCCSLCAPSLIKISTQL